MSKVTIKATDPQTGESIIIAEGVIGEDLIEADGSYYFFPTAVNTDQLEKTDETYTCPYKGLCYYYTLTNEGHEVKTQVSWVYEEPKEGWDKIAGKFGFYTYDNDGVIVEIDE